MFEFLTNVSMPLVFLYTLGGIGWDWWDDLDSGPQWGWKDQLQWVQVTQKSMKMGIEICFTWMDVLILRALFFFCCLFYTGTINSGPLIYSPNHAEMMLWIPGGLRQVIIRNFQFEPRQFEEMFKTKILQNKGDDGRLPVDHPGGHGDEDEDCSEGQPTPASRKQHRLEPLIRCRKPFIGFRFYSVFQTSKVIYTCNMTGKICHLPILIHFLILPLNDKEQSICVRCIICLIRFGENIFLLPRLLLREPCCDAD